MKGFYFVTLIAAALLFAACGEDGVAGKTSLIKTSDEPAGENCLQGGIRIEAGIDMNSNGALDPDEVKDLRFFCHGEGDAGCTITDNEDGTKTIACGGDASITVSDGDGTGDCTITDNGNGTQTIECGGVEVTVKDVGDGGGHDSLVVIDDDSSGTCPNGGQKVTVGIDMNDNGTLDTDEITTTKYICDGVDGNDSLTTVDPVEPGADCAAGGYEIKNGVDGNGNGTLDPGEVVSDTFVCNGANGHSAMTETTTLAAGEEGCVAGGHLFKNGVDANDNGALDDGEYEEVVVCNGEKGDPGEDGVCAGNHAPVIEEVVLEETADGIYRAGVTYTLTVTATDADGDTIDIKIVGMGAEIVPGAAAGEFEMTPVMAGQKINFAVVASDGCQITMDEFTIDEVTYDPEPPTLGDPTIYFNSVLGNSVVASWEKAWDNYSDSEDLEYRVVYSLDGDEIDTIEKIMAGGGTLAADWTFDIGEQLIDGLTDAALYWVAVVVRDEHHNTTLYNLASIMTPDVTAPAGDADISFSAVTSYSLTVSWSPATDNASPADRITYKVVWSTDEALIDTEVEVADMSGPGVLFDGEADVTSQELLYLDADTTYYFNVLARDEAGNFLMYGVESVTTLADSPLATVKNLKVTGGDALAVLTWEDPGDPRIDHIEIMWTPDDPAVPVSAAVSDGYVIVPDLDNDTEYTFTITSYDGADEPSLDLTATVTPKHPGMLYVITGAGGSTPVRLYAVDASTAEATLIGDTGLHGSGGLAIHPTTGKAYIVTTSSGTDGSPELYELSLEDASVDFIGEVGADFAQVPDLAFGPDGTLYGWTESSDDLFTIDLTTGEGTLIPDEGENTWATGIAFDLSGKMFLKQGNEMLDLNPVTGLDTYIADITGIAVQESDGDWVYEGHNGLDVGANGYFYTIVRNGNSWSTSPTTTYLYAVSPNGFHAIEIGDMEINLISAVEFARVIDDQQFSGIKRNVPQMLLTDWEVCYADTYADSGTLMTDILADCDGANLMLACRKVDSPLLTLAAWAPRADALFNTGDNQTTTHNANGASWYFYNEMSWGFAPEDAGVNKNSCDYDDGGLGQQDVRLCWHVWGNELSGGYRCGELNADDGMPDGNDQWERVILQVD